MDPFLLAWLQIPPAAQAGLGLGVLGGAEVLAAERHPLELPDVRRVGGVEHLALPGLHAVGQVHVVQGQAVQDPNDLQHSPRRSSQSMARRCQAPSKVS